MKHQIPDVTLSNVEALSLTEDSTMPRRERVLRWASLLEAHGGSLNALRQIEYLSPDERRAYRGADTPMSVAFDDPVLRREGLASDRLGDAMDFFEMSDEDAHHLFCDCHYNGTMTGAGLAQRLRRHAELSESGGVWNRARNILLMGRAI